MTFCTDVVLFRFEHALSVLLRHTTSTSRAMISYQEG